jgi:hypothetical protein
MVGGPGRVWMIRGLGLGRSRQIRARGKLLRASGALPADSVRPEIPAEPEPVGSRKTERIQTDDR